ncbi:MAG: hypothetical protein U0174_11565 [Polyangiaceae bacterium]
MKKHTFPRMLGICAVVAACSSDPTPNPTGTDTDISDVLYEGDATDEALEALVAAPLKTGMASSISAPTQWQTISKAAPFTFAWSQPKQAFSIMSLLEGTAYAHGTPVNGSAYLLTFSTPQNAKLVRVFTAKNTYVPSADAWNKLASAKTTITLRVRAATFEDNRVIATGGPYDSSAISFTVAP